MEKEPERLARVRMRKDRNYAGPRGTASPGQLTPAIPQAEADSLVAAGYADPESVKSKVAPVDPLRPKGQPETATTGGAPEKATTDPAAPPAKRGPFFRKGKAAEAPADAPAADAAKV